MKKDKIIHSIKETELQKSIHNLLSEPATIRQTVSGRRLQILSPGRINPFEGPDFSEVAILLDGYVILGDAEFHKKSSDWLAHSHQNDERYSNVILHIVLADDIPDMKFPFETLIINDYELNEYLVKETIIEPDIASIEDLQHYALIRLLRKSSEAQKILNQKGIDETLTVLTREYTEKYNSRRKRPVYTHNQLNEIIDSLNNSMIMSFLQDLTDGKTLLVSDLIQKLVKTKISNEGAHLRREIILNCALPLALCLASEESRINLFLWFWSTPSLHTYGILSRKFRNLPQNFLWQQQGMLEYMKEFGRKQNIVREAMVSYGFAEVLSFYRLGRAPFRDVIDNEEI